MISAPQILIAFRAGCAPAIFVLACFGFHGTILAAVLVAGFLSDVLDGMIARRTGQATPALRYADTIVDTIFYVAAAIALRVVVPDLPPPQRRISTRDRDWVELRAEGIQRSIDDQPGAGRSRGNAVDNDQGV